MSYTKTNWHDGDTISAAKLNKLENGIENSLSTELQALYKTLVGKDYAGDPNPTDAEMIDAIAKDATSGGSGGGSLEPFIVPITGREEGDSGDTASGGHYTTWWNEETEWDDFSAAINAGRPIKFVWSESLKEQNPSYYLDDFVLSALQVSRMNYQGNPNYIAMVSGLKSCDADQNYFNVTCIKTKSTYHTSGKKFEINLITHRFG